MVDVNILQHITDYIQVGGQVNRYSRINIENIKGKDLAHQLLLQEQRLQS